MTAPDQSWSPRLVPSTNLVTVHAAAAEEHGAAMRRRRLGESDAPPERWPRQGSPGTPHDECANVRQYFGPARRLTLTESHLLHPVTDT
jgi:hypothetical protein